MSARALSKTVHVALSSSQDTRIARIQVFWGKTDNVNSSGGWDKKRLDAGADDVG
jgi:hypothetical protein